jgi:transcriptional regulator with XRE-family HTH domain
MATQSKELVLNSLAKALKKYRKDKKITQEDLARTLNISQTYLSRIEAGDENFRPSMNVLQAISRIILYPTEERVKADSKFGKVKFFTREKWAVASFGYPRHSGDKVVASQKGQGDKIAFMHCDAAGSNKLAASTAQQLEIAFETVIAAVGEQYLNVEILYTALNEALRVTIEPYKGLPSAFFMVGRKNQFQLSVINAGMPAPYFYSRRSKSGSIKEIAKSPPIGSPQRGMSTPNIEVFTLEPGDVFFTFSDGFLEYFNDQMSRDLITTFSSISMALKGDVEGISSKLLQLLEKVTQSSFLDDASFLMIGRRN